MNVAIVRGRLSSPPRTHQLPSGDVLTALEVTVPATDDSPASSLPVAWFGAPPATAAWPEGLEVVVVGRVRRRWFRAGPTTQSRTELLAERVVPAGRRSAVARAVGAVRARLEAGL